MTDERSDATLLADHAAGDRSAFAELHARHRSRLRRLAGRHVRNDADADDVLQDALLAVHRAAGSFRQDAAVHSWLHRIVVNSCIDRVRRRRDEAPLSVCDAERWTTPDPAGAVETAVVVRRALMVLPAEQRAAIIAVDMHGYSVAEAARLLGIAQGTVKSRRARGRARLALLLHGTLVG